MVPQADAVAIPASTLVETAFPFVQVSRLVKADRRLRDPVYGMHRWFARRPPTLVRALLLAAALPDSSSGEVFWQRHGDPGAWLGGVTVYDAFAGGGTSLVEAARMGASVVGRDVDPLAASVVAAELTPSAATDAAVIAEELLAHLTRELGDIYGLSQGTWTPLHWFWLRRVTCPDCDGTGLLYRDLVLAASRGRRGAVVRDSDVHAFCPDCLAVHALRSSRTHLRCCGRSRKLAAGTYEGQRYTCTACGSRSSHECLGTGAAERVLVGVEETAGRERRRIRAADEADRALVVRARGEAPDRSELVLPTRAFERERRDRRPVSLGFERPVDLLTERQQLLFGRAFAWLAAKQTLDAGVRRALTLLLTGCLGSNNVLCGYARDYGRLAPLFSVRGYALPALSVELNALHPTAGRGTLASGLRRVARAGSSDVQRHALVDGVLTRQRLRLPVRPASVDVVCASADDTGAQQGLRADVCVTDPPYFDYIAYSELSEFYRAWLDAPALGGDPLLPQPEDAAQGFADGLARCLKVTVERLAPDAPIVFTYHSPHEEAWRAIGLALDEAGMTVTAVWPVLADPHMGHHSTAGNCEWDVVVCCRPTPTTSPSVCETTLQEWVVALGAAGLVPNDTDRASFRLALAVAAPRFGRRGTSSLV